MLIEVDENGRELQRRVDATCQWVPHDRDVLNVQRWEYRLKPKPRMLQLWRHELGGELVARPIEFFSGINCVRVGKPFPHPEDV